MRGLDVGEQNCGEMVIGARFNSPILPGSNTPVGCWYTQVAALAGIQRPFSPAGLRRSPLPKQRCFMRRGMTPLPAGRRALLGLLLLLGLRAAISCPVIENKQAS